MYKVLSIELQVIKKGDTLRNPFKIIIHKANQTYSFDGPHIHLY